MTALVTAWAQFGHRLVTTHNETLIDVAWLVVENANFAEMEV